jgi:hypothetical protein
VLPFWAIICGAALGSAIETIRRSRLKPGKAFTAAAVCLVVGLLCVPVRHQFRMSPAELYRWTYGPGNPFYESPLAAKRVAALTHPDDWVFVAGSEPQILYYAKRKSPTRFVIVYPLMLPSPFAEGYQEETLHALKARPPEVIVLSNTRFSWLANPKSPQLLIPFLEQLFQSGAYNLVGGYVWGKGGCQWREPPHPELVSQGTLLIFRLRREAQETPMRFPRR